MHGLGDRGASWRSLQSQIKVGVPVKWQVNIVLWPESHCQQEAPCSQCAETDVNTNADECLSCPHSPTRTHVC